MTNETQTNQNSPTTGVDNTLNPSSNSVAVSATSLANLCAAGLVACFFLPWIQVLFVKASGFQFSKEGGKLLLLWAIPIFGVITLLAGVSKSPQRTAAQVAGILPLGVLGYALYNSGSDLLSALQLGAYASVALGVILLLVSQRLK